MQTSTPSQVYYVRSSSNPGVFYMVAENSRGFLECDCRGSQFRRDRPCKHCKAVASGQVKPATPARRPAPAPAGVGVGPLGAFGMLEPAL